MKKQKLKSIKDYFQDSDEFKTVKHIKKESFSSIHSMLRSITGESVESFIIRFKILHSIATRAINPRLKLEEIAQLLGIDGEKISSNLQTLKEGGIVDNKGGQHWRIKPCGRRLLDNLTIMLFEHNDDFDDIDLVRASLTHLNELAREYGLDLNVEARIIRFFDDILTELEETAIELLDPSAAKRAWNLLRKSDRFYNHIRSWLYRNPNIPTRETWFLLERLAKRHQVVGELVIKLNQRIAILSNHIELEDALSHYLDIISPEIIMMNYSNYVRFNILQISPKIYSEALVKKFNKFKFREPPQKLPNFAAFKIQKPKEIDYLLEIDEDADIFLKELTNRSHLDDLKVSDLIDINSWEKSSSILILLAYLSSEGKIKLLDNQDVILENCIISRIRNSKVRIIGKF